MKGRIDNGPIDAPIEPSEHSLARFPAHHPYRVKITQQCNGTCVEVSLLSAGCSLGLLVSQLNHYTLSPVSEEPVSEAAGVSFASCSFGLSVGLAFAGSIMLGTFAIAFTSLAESSTVLAPAEQQQVTSALEEDAQIMSNTASGELLLAGQPSDVQAEVIRINTEARHLALQVAFVVPLLASGGHGQRVPDAASGDPKPSQAVEGSRYPGTAAWYSVSWLACSMKAWPTIGPLTEPVRIHIAASTKLYGLSP